MKKPCFAAIIVVLEIAVLFGIKRHKLSTKFVDYIINMIFYVNMIPILTMNDDERRNIRKNEKRQCENIMILIYTFSYCV